MNESLKTAERPRQVDAVSVKTVERSPKQQVLVDDSSQISSNYNNNNNNNNNKNNKNNKRLLILYSSSTSGRPTNEETAHNRALTILKGMRIDDQSQYLEQVDGASTDPKDRERRNELLALSGSISRQYPLFFLVDSNDIVKFLCEWETFELMNDVGILTGFMNLGNTSYTTTNRASSSSSSSNTMTTTTTASSSTSTNSIQKQDDVNYGDRRRSHSRNNSCPLLVTTIRPLRSSTRLVDDERTNTNQTMIIDGRKQVTVIAGHNYDDAVEDEVEKQLSIMEVKQLELVKDVIVVKEENDVFALGELIDYYKDEERKELIKSETIKS
ncbi:hypothetical protein FRACYDRAFT_250240 [Fragilariopsis cylindrus CCMP1102]|uniref:Uncharacterized protein n=1 Tax=Fragilariopsis cylindrus CCMP1102 TaxID=635003 RepID=A0A1E7EPW5_9STRA|nr:hypothetical protein FRACYDRAFT_250240 [Fragilariopsis cylindrus CCMP1102]|eukprot:OEU08020.1 hypothetical protein FRACYDRAFT_250240 [Fragilariopsis cylindrus CCMP1102]